MIVDTQRFEALLESLGDEIDNLEVGFKVKSNLTGIHSALYSIYEDFVGLDYENQLDQVIKENEVLKNLLVAYLSEEDKRYISIKYDIEF